MGEQLPKWFGPYVLLGRLGQGSAGAAYLARPAAGITGVPTPVVIKVLHPNIAENPEFVQRFRHEGELAVCVDSSHVAKVYDLGAYQEELYIALEYVPGWTIGRILGLYNRDRKMMTLPEVAEFVDQSLSGLDALHNARDQRGRALEVVHRDISPKNLMLGDDGIVRVIDLGLGKSKAQEWKTRMGRVMGSPGYMPPEQITAESVDRRADLYGLAVVIHELLTSQRYIAIDNSVKMMQATLEKSYLPVANYRRDSSPQLDQVLKKALSFEARDRYPTANDLKEALLDSLPAPCGARGLAQLVKSAHPKQQQARLAEVHRLISAPLPPDEEEPAQESTIVYVRRDGVEHLPQGPMDDRTEVAKTRVQVGSVPSAVPMPSTGPMPIEGPGQPRLLDPASVSSGTIWGRLSSQLRTRESMFTVGLALVVGFIGGIAATRGYDSLTQRHPVANTPAPVVDRPSPAVTEPVVSTKANPVPTPVPSQPRPGVSSAQPGATANRAASKTPKRTISKRPQRTKSSAQKVARRVNTPPPPSGQTREGLLALNRSLMGRASRLRKSFTAGTPQSAQVRRILSRLSLARSVEDPTRLGAQLKNLKKEVEGLEKQLP